MIIFPILAYPFARCFSLSLPLPLVPKVRARLWGNAFPLSYIVFLISERAFVAAGAHAAQSNLFSSKFYLKLMLLFWSPWNFIVEFLLFVVSVSEASLSTKHVSNKYMRKMSVIVHTK